MSKSYNHNLDPIINQHLRWNIPNCWKNVECRPDKGVTEICDVIAVTSESIHGLWLSQSGHPVYIPGGVTLVSEYKDSKSDLRADETKACRRRGVRAMGDYRMIWIREDGNIQPHDIEEEGPHYGWGVVVFNEQGAHIVREPLRMRNVNHWESNHLQGRLIREEEQTKYASRLAQERLGGRMDFVKTTSAPRSETIREENGTYTDRHTQAAEAYIDEMPAKTSLLLRHLEDETNWIGSPDKLTKHLKKNSNRLVAPPAGGDWTIRKVGKKCG